jgi:hypothetical protein
LNTESSKTQSCRSVQQLHGVSQTKIGVLSGWQIEVDTSPLEEVHYFEICVAEMGTLTFRAQLRPSDQQSSSHTLLPGTVEQSGLLATHHSRICGGDSPCLVNCGLLYRRIGFSRYDSRTSAPSNLEQRTLHCGRDPKKSKGWQWYQHSGIGCLRNSEGRATNMSTVAVLAMFCETHG